MPDSDRLLWDQAIDACCQEPVHIPGHIQPFGALLAADRTLERLTHVSENLASLLGRAAAGWDSASVLGRDPGEILSAELVHELRNVCGLPWIDTQREQLGAYEIAGQTLEVSVHLCGDRTLIELEPPIAREERPQTLISRVKALLQGPAELTAILARIAGILREATGFDRIMVYRFMHDGAGEVIAEACGPEADSFLGLRYPATDIPDSARALFQKNSLRVIPDVLYEPAPLLAWDEAGAAPLDLSLARLRGASLIHRREYLPNMGVRASMALAIVVEGELWGLFACHHGTPRLLSSELRSAIELCGLLVSLHIQQKISEREFHNRQRSAEILSSLFGQPTKTDNSWKSLIVQAQDRLCQMLSADGMAFATNGTILARYGTVPPEAVISDLMTAVGAESESEILAFESFAQVGLSVPTDCSSAGGLVFAVKFTELHYLAFFRNESIAEVRWAGNPTAQTVKQNISGVGMSPQRSFEAYTQLVEGFALPWSRQDLAVASELKHALETQIFLQERQNLLIAELKHRVKNILALIHSVARQTSTGTRSAAEYARVLEQRIAALAKAHDLVVKNEALWPSLRDLLATQLRPYMDRESPQAEIIGPDVSLSAGLVPTFSLVLHELVSNAVKYGALSVPTGRLSAYWIGEKDGLGFHWREIGGPAVAPPTRRGFGRELIERAIPYEFDGEADLHFAPTGFEANFWLPGEHVRWSTDVAPKAKTSRRQSQPAKVVTAGDRGPVLVVEDNMLIAIEMEARLRELGFTEIDSAPSVTRALGLIDERDYKFCLLDVNLKKELSFEVAYVLTERQVPFAFTTGYDSKHPIPNALRTVPLLKKPIARKALEKLVASFVRTTGNP